MEPSPGSPGRFRRWVHVHRAPLALLFLAPAIPELLTGSTPVSELVFNPPGFLVGFSLDVALYGCGALLIREFSIAYRKGWASILLHGAAYGIAEEGFEVHTFFQTRGSPVDALGSYGHLWGVNWLWALALMVFHATYSIALPILLTYLWFPEKKGERWLTSRTIRYVTAVFVLEVVGFGFIVGHGPSPAALAFFVALVGGLIALALWAPRHLLKPAHERRTIGNYALIGLGAGEFTAYFFVLVLAGTAAIPAIATGAMFVLVNLGVLVYLLRTVGTDRLERSEFQFAVGMLSVLFLWDVLLEFILVPGILVVTALFVYMLYRLGRKLAQRQSPSPVRDGATGLAPPAG